MLTNCTNCALLKFAFIVAMVALTIINTIAVAVNFLGGWGGLNERIHGWRNIKVKQLLSQFCFDALLALVKSCFDLPESYRILSHSSLG